MEVAASPPSASTIVPGTQRSLEVKVSSTPAQPTVRFASAGHFFPVESGADHFVTTEEVQ